MVGGGVVVGFYVQFLQALILHNVYSITIIEIYDKDKLSHISVLSLSVHTTLLSSHILLID